MKENYMDPELQQIHSIAVRWVGGGITLLLLIIAGCMAGCPPYNVWEQAQEGRAALAKADYDRQTAVVEAQAKNAAAKELAEAEITRAEGVARANQIVANGLGGPQGYLTYLWIEKVAGSSNTLVYVPSQGGLPILEAGRLPAK